MDSGCEFVQTESFAGAPFMCPHGAVATWTELCDVESLPNTEVTVTLGKDTDER